MKDFEATGGPSRLPKVLRYMTVICQLLAESMLTCTYFGMRVKRDKWIPANKIMYII